MISRTYLRAGTCQFFYKLCQTLVLLPYPNLPHRQHPFGAYCMEVLVEYTVGLNFATLTERKDIGIHDSWLQFLCRTGALI